MEIEYEIGEVVYLRTDRDQLERLVYSLEIMQNTVHYVLVNGTTVSKHAGFEISKNKQV